MQRNYTVKNNGCEKLVNYKLAVLPGDGVGPEVVNVAKSLLDAVAIKSNIELHIVEFKAGAAFYKETGKVWEDGAFDFCKDEADAILLGAMGIPGILTDEGATPAGKVIFKLRFGLDLYANVRPTRLYPSVRARISDRSMDIWTPGSVDLVIIRENTEGLYTPIRGVLHRNGEDELAIDTRVITKKGSERIIDFAFRTAMARQGAPGDGVHRVTCVDKSNVLSGCKLFRNIYELVADRYQDIEKDYAYVDAFAQWLIRKPEHYDVVVCSNLFGDILTDLSAVLQGGMGMAPSGNIGENKAMFEPVHGSAPKYAGKDVINPVAMLLSVKMMLRWLGIKHEDMALEKAATDLEQAVINILTKGEILTKDLGGKARCSEMGQAIRNEYESID